MDRTSELLAAVEGACKAQGLTQAQVQHLKSSRILKPKRAPSSFSSAATAVAKSINDLRAFIKSHQHDYISSGTYSNAEKDRIEAEVGMFVKACTQQVDQLKESVLAGQNPRTGQPLTPHVAAHLHGIVLILAEQLHVVSAAFDKVRAERHRQASEREQWRRKPLRTAAASPSKPSTSGQHAAAMQDSGRSGGTSGQHAQQQAEATTFDQENRSLIEHLNGTTQQVVGLEKTLRDIATLNHMLSTAVLHQAQAIEAIYDNAVEATGFVERGNQSLTKTVAVNRSTRRYVLVLIIVASICLLFFDWMNS